MTSPNSKTPPRERIWRAMRQLRSFELGQLVTATETKRETTSGYVSALRRAGYLVGRNGRLVLVRNSGPKPPRVLKDYLISKRPLGVEDANTGERYGIDGNDPPPPPPQKVVPRPIVRRPYRRAAARPPMKGAQ